MSSLADRAAATLWTGMTLVAASAVIWSTAGIFAKAVSAGVWPILFWRGVFSAGFIAIYLCWRRGRAICGDLARLGAPGWLAAGTGAAATVCFITAFKHTSVANVGVIYATAPFVAALMAYALTRERTARSTLMAAFAALAGVAITVSGSFGSGSLYGDAMAFAMTCGMALVWVLIRMYPDLPMVLAGAMSSLILVAIAPMASDPFAISMHDLGWLAGFGVMFAAATILATEGTRLIPAPQSALIGALETPLAPVWAWVVLGEWPANATWFGGALVLGAVVFSVSRQKV